MFIAFKFFTDKEARAVYDTIRSCTCKLGTLEKLLAFTYQGVPREKKVDGWGLYDPRREFARQGISPKSAEKGWRFTEINKDYSVSWNTGFGRSGSWGDSIKSTCRDRRAGPHVYQELY
jgi:hypothetical protein